MDKTKLLAKGILFDLDGTIFDTVPAYIEAARRTFKTIGQPIPENAKMLEIPKRIEQRENLNDILKCDTKVFLDVYLKTFYDISTSEARPFPNITKTLETLSKKAKLAVITMRCIPSASIIGELQKFGLNKFFAHVVTALDTHKPKPSPEGLIKAVKALDVQMCDCIIVGDSTVDVKAGKAAGALTVSVLTGLYSREELAKAEPDFILNNITELPQLIN
jgi:HAD superfamily hydrolase (TIGR01509 family)